jgi:uncharacterized membrane protein
MQKILVAGILIIFLGFGLLLGGSLGQGTVSTGGVVFIGPFPIVFGSGPNGWVLALMSVLIGGIMVALFALWGWRFRRVKGD